MKSIDLCYTASLSLSRSHEVQKLLSLPLSYVFPFKSYKAEGAFVGWGYRKQSKQAKFIADKLTSEFWCLEDGFISYLGHPALGDRRFSLIVDKSGIYYDATKPSDLENLLNSPDWLTPELQARSSSVLETVRKNRISKYNHEPVNYGEERTPTALESGLTVNFENVGYYPKSGHKHFAPPNLQVQNNRVLVVDQTYGDCSVKYGMADESSFKAMLDAALSENPDSEVWVKVHPDVVLGKKKGYFEIETCGQKIKGFDDNRIRVLADKVNAQSLFPYFEKVYVVTSQLGFEALWHGKEVVCFGIPFYGGWSLTDDRVPCHRRKQQHTIESLFAAACLKYTRYIDPETGERCELEDVVKLIALQRQYQQQEVNTLYLVGFSCWKRAFLKYFLGGLAQEIKYIKSANKASQLAKAGDGVLIWGAKSYEYVPPQGVKLYRCEDAFIRGVGLGAELKRPQSMTLDRRGIYFDCSRPSDLEHAINNVQLSHEQIQRGIKLRRQLVEQRVSKYNLAGNSHEVFSCALPGQKKVLVAGQVDSDASIKLGSPVIRSNRELLEQVRTHNEDAYIVYKPHPDVVHAGRPGHISEVDAQEWADKLASDSDIFDCISQCDELHVMTSLAGFEALLQSKTVHTWGCPFYANWGVTVDHVPCERRQAIRSVDELVYFAYDYYSRYVNWNTGRFTTPERLMNAIVHASHEDHESHKILKWFSRKKRKIGYLLEAFKS